MPIALATSPSWSLLGLTFIVGFIVALLILTFIQRKPQQARSTTRPKHALGRPPKTPNPKTSQAETATVESGTTNTTPENGQQQDPAPTEPDPFANSLVEFPTLPSNLFEQRYQAKFDRTRKRLHRLRTQLNEQH